MWPKHFFFLWTASFASLTLSSLSSDTNQTDTIQRFCHIVSPSRLPHLLLASNWCVSETFFFLHIHGVKVSDSGNDFLFLNIATFLYSQHRSYEMQSVYFIYLLISSVPCSFLTWLSTYHAWMKLNPVALCSMDHIWVEVDGGWCAVDGMRWMVDETHKSAFARVCFYLRIEIGSSLSHHQPIVHWPHGIHQRALANPNLVLTFFLHVVVQPATVYLLLSSLPPSLLHVFSTFSLLVLSSCHLVSLFVAASQ